MATPNPIEQGARRALEERAASAYERQAERGDGNELRSQDHGADDQDLGVDDDRDAGQQGRQGHEREIGPVELGLLVGPLGDLGPDHGVGAAAGGVPFGVVPGLRDPGGDGFEVDRAGLGDAQGLQTVDDLVRGFPGHVGEHDVALG